MIEGLSIDTIANGAMGISFILYLIYDKKFLMKELVEKLNIMDLKIDDIRRRF